MRPRSGGCRNSTGSAGPPPSGVRSRPATRPTCRCSSTSNRRVPARRARPTSLDLLTRGAGELQIVAEVTERSVASDPAGLIAAIEELRAHTNRIALDDVGSDAASQAMMSLIRPDVIKLDRAVVQGPDSPDVHAVVDAVLAEAKRTGAVILAEGIETPRHLDTAKAMGATLGQGWLFGHPGPLPKRPTGPR